MRCWLGPPIWTPNRFGHSWEWPDGTLSVIDLRPLADCALAGVYGDHPHSFVIADDHSDLSKQDGYMLVCDGDPRDSRPDAAAIEAWGKHAGVPVQGDTFADLLWSHLTIMADPLGLDSCKPIMPGIHRQLEMLCGGMLKQEAFRYGEHALTNAVQAVLQADFRGVFNESLAGKHIADFPAKVVDYWCEKLRIDKSDKAAWEKLIPADLRAEIPILKPHATTHTDDFDGTDSGTLGKDLTWTEVDAGWNNTTNRAEVTGGGASEKKARAEHSVTGADHEVQADVPTLSPTGYNTMCVAARYHTSDNTHYYYRVENNGGTLASYLRKNVTGTDTGLASGVFSGAFSPIKVYCSGSTIKSYKNSVEIHSVTDTAITGNLRGGLRSYADATGRANADNWSIADLATGHPAMRRWSMTSGGVFRPAGFGQEGVQVI